MATYLIFELADSCYGLEARYVRELAWLPEITPVADLGMEMEGVVNFRGQVVPVMNLRRRFGAVIQRPRPSDAVIMLDVDNTLFGVIVETVREVRSFAPAEIEALRGPHAIVDSRGPLFAGAAKAGEAIILLLDVQRLNESRGVLDSASESWNWLQAAEPGQAADEYLESDKALMHQRAVSLAQAPKLEATESLMSLAVVRIATEYFGVSLSVVREFLELRRITPVPCCPEHIVGAINLRGEILTLVDIRSAFALPPISAADTRLMVVETGNFRAGIVVDEVVEVASFQPEQVMPVPSAVKLLNEECVRGAVPLNGAVLSIIDLPQLFDRQDWIVEEQV